MCSWVKWFCGVRLRVRDDFVGDHQTGPDVDPGPNRSIEMVVEESPLRELAAK